MKIVKAKFKVEKLEVYENVTNVTMKAVIVDNKNIDWSKWTPSGMIQMSITNPDCLDYFVPGDDIDIEFSKREVIE